MGYQFWGERAHEWVGTGLFALFIAHHILNFGWYKSLFSGKYTASRTLMAVVDGLALACMAALIYSGILLSREVFAFLPFESGLALARRLHILDSHWGFLLMSLHLGLHWNALLARLKGKGPAPFHGGRVMLSLAGLAAAVCGGWVFVKRDLATCLFLRSEFVFLDYEEPKLLFYIDYLALAGSCIFIAHYLAKWLRPAQRSGGGK